MTARLRPRIGPLPCCRPVLALALVLASALGLDATSAGAVVVLSSATTAPLPAGAAAKPQFDQVDSMSCPAAGDCVAVGFYEDAHSSTIPLLDVESAGVWRAITAPLPAFAVKSADDAGLFSDLDAVDCTAVGDCVAVGKFDAVGGYVYAIVDIESNGTWRGTVAPIPSSAGTSALADNFLNAVSCTSTGNCVAVGSFAESAQQYNELLVDVESDGTWTALDPPLPPGASTTPENNDLDAVACPAVGDCTAVGSYEDDDDALQAVIETDAAGTWSAIAAPLPAGASTTPVYNALDAVACPTATSCVAVGDDDKANLDQEALIDEDTDGTWTAIAAPLPAGASGAPAANDLQSVACATTGECDAVGAYEGPRGDQAALLDVLTAATWRAVVAPLPAGAGGSPVGNDLDAISCTAARTCVAVGDYDLPSESQLPLIDTEAGGTWAVTAVALPTGAVTAAATDLLVASTCTSVAGCEVGGTYSHVGNSSAGVVARVYEPAVPSAPRGVHATAGSLDAKVTWAVPLSDGGSPVTKYVVTAAPGGRTCVATKTLSCTVLHLKDAVTYTFTVVAANAAGDSPASVPSPAVKVK